MVFFYKGIEFFKCHSGGICKISDAGRGIVSGSMKQKINTHSSAEAELIRVDDLISKVLWTTLFFNTRVSPRCNVLL